LKKKDDVERIKQNDQKFNVSKNRLVALWIIVMMILDDGVRPLKMIIDNHVSYNVCISYTA
jgi:hypothetical protein